MTLPDATCTVGGCGKTADRWFNVVLSLIHVLAAAAFSVVALVKGQDASEKPSEPAQSPVIRLCMSEGGYLVYRC